MTRSTLISVSAPLCLLLACTGQPPIETTSDTAATESESDGTTTDSTTTLGTTSLTTTATTTTTTMGTTATTTTMGTTASTSMGSTTTETTGNPPECTADNGMPDAKCDAATPFCYEGECVDCQGAMNDAACSGVDADKPVCSSEGVCVQCTAESAEACSGTTPVCDTSNECVGCSEHSQCATACAVDGSCFPPDYVIYVDKGAADCMVGDGSMEMPFCALAEAFTKISEPDNLPAMWTVKIKIGTYSAMENITPAGSTIALIADGGPVIIRSTGDGAAGLTTGDGSTLYTSGIVLSLNDGSGLKCSASTVYAADTQMKSNQMHGVETIDCSTSIKRGLVTANKQGGVASYGPGKTSVVNSYITVNGNAASEFGGIRSAQMNDLDVLFSTVIANDGGQVASVQCIENGAAEIRNSVVLGRTNNPSVDCPTAVVSYSVVDGGDMQGDGNMVASDAEVKLWWQNPVGGVYRVLELVDDLPSPIASVAMWMAGDPAWDYDGNPRMASEGAMDFPGADVP